MLLYRVMAGHTKIIAPTELHLGKLGAVGPVAGGADHGAVPEDVPVGLSHRMVGSTVLEAGVTPVAQIQLISIQQVGKDGAVNLVALAAAEEGVGAEEIVIADFIVAEQTEVSPAVQGEAAEEFIVGRVVLMTGQADLAVIKKVIVRRISPAQIMDVFVAEETEVLLPFFR